MAVRRAVVVWAAAVVISCGLLALPLIALAATSSVNIQGSAFVPPTTMVRVGDTVSWTNRDAFSHTSTSDTGAWNSDVIRAGSSFSFTFRAARRSWRDRSEERLPRSPDDLRQLVLMTVVARTGQSDDVAEILVTAEQIAAKVRELGARIATDYQSKDLVLVSILKGALPFLADLMRATPIPLSLDFLEVSSYGAGTESTGAVRILKDLANPIEGRHVLVVEDILDTGHTLSYVFDHLRAQRPESVRLCVLLDKPARRVIPIEIDYRGFEIADKFVVGYGLDYAEHYRNLPFVGVLKPEVYARRS